MDYQEGFSPALEIDIMKMFIALTVYAILAGFCLALLCAILPLNTPGWLVIFRPLTALGVVMAVGILLTPILSYLFGVLGELPEGLQEDDCTPALLWVAWLVVQTAFVVWMMVLDEFSWLPQVLLDSRRYLVADEGYGGYGLAGFCNAVLFIFDIGWVIAYINSGGGGNYFWRTGRSSSGSGGCSSYSTAGSSPRTQLSQPTPITSYESPPMPAAPTRTYQAPRSAPSYNYGAASGSSLRTQYSQPTPTPSYEPPPMPAAPTWTYQAPPPPPPVDYGAAERARTEEQHRWEHHKRQNPQLFGPQ